jgi:hypothetical protein
LINVDAVPELDVDAVDLDSASGAAQLIAPRMEGRLITDAYAAVDAAGLVHGLALLADHGTMCEVAAVMAIGTPGTPERLLITATVAAWRDGYASIWLDGREADYTVFQHLGDAAESLGWSRVADRPSIAVGVSSRSWWTLDLTAIPDPTEEPSELPDADCGV